MKKLFYRWWKILLLLFFIPFTTSAQIDNDSLIQKINALLNGDSRETGVVRRATLLSTAEKRMALCDEPRDRKSVV